MGRSPCHSINARRLLLQLPVQVRREGQPQIHQGFTLRLREDHTACTRLGQEPLLSPQQIQIPGLLPPHGGHAAHHDAVQGLGDGAHLVLAQKQAKQPGEAVQIPDRLPQKGRHLLHRPHQNVPELLLLLGAAPVPRRLKGGGQLLQPPGGLHLFQEGV